jgi:enterochelin esterase-like enzyme
MADWRQRIRQVHPPVVSAVIVAAVVATGIRFGVVHHNLPLSVAYRSGFSGRALLAGRFHTVLSSQLLTRDGFMLTSIVASLAVMLGGYEMLAGSRPAAIVAVTGAIAGPVVVALVLSAGSGFHMGFASRTLSTLDYGASAVTAAAGGALVGFLDRRWLRIGAVAFVVGGLLLHHQMADWEHLVAFPLGYAIASSPRWLLGERRRLSKPASPTWQVTGIALAAVGVVVGSLGASMAVDGPVTAHAASVKPSTPGNPAAPGTTLPPLSPLRLIETRYPAPSMGGTRKVLVVVPSGYDNGTKSYPVIEILHGRPGSPEDILTGMDLLGVMAKAPPFIAVVPDGHGPVVSDGDFADTSRQRLGTAVSDDLRTWVTTTYRTNSVWGITGLSSGGYGAAYLASRPGGGYQKVCPMSGYFTAVDPPFKGEGRVVRAAASPLLHVSRTGPPTLLIVGNQDKEGLAEAHTYIAAMQAVGQPIQMDILTGSHDWGVWHAGLPVCITFLLT